MAEYGGNIEVFPNAHIKPTVTEEELSRFANGAAKEIRSLTIGSEEEFEENRPPVKLSILANSGLPNLKKLKIVGLIDELKLNATSAPKLEEIDIWHVEEGPLLKLDLALPELISFSAQYTMLAPETGDGFSLSMTRCPKIQTIKTYKFRCLAGPNYMVLPECRELVLHRSEVTKSLEILHAPNLDLLSVQAAYSLSHVRLWDFPDATREDVENLFSGQLRFKDLKNRNRGLPRDVLPLCMVNRTNMFVDGPTKKHLAANPRVTVDENDDDD